MKTVMEEAVQQEYITVKYPYSMEDTRKITFGILGQTPERSYEDRSVYFTVKTSETPPEESCSAPEVDFSMWLNGEDAIELGLRLIAHGNFALKANMYQHQLIHHKSELFRFIEAGKVRSVVFEFLQENCSNFGVGWHKFLVKPIWKGKAPKYYEDFSYEEVIYWSPLKKDFKQQKELYKVPVIFSGYDHKKKVKEFNKVINQEGGKI